MATSFRASGEAERIIPRPSARRLHTGSVPPTPPEPIAPSRSDSSWGAAFFSVSAPLLIIAASIGFGVIGLTGRAETTAAILVVPLLATVVWISVRRWLRPSYGHGFAAVALAGLGVRYLAAIPRLLGAVDAVVYQREGARLATSFRAFDFAVDTGRPIPGTGSLRYTSGLVNTLTGSSYVSTYLVFTTLAFVGQLLFLIAFRPSLTDRQFRLATLFVMFSPSLVFWPSSIGKEAAILFGLGLLVYGASRVYRREGAGVLPLAAGLIAVGLVRPHVAMIALGALIVGLLTRERDVRSRMVVHTAVLGLVLVGSMLITGASANLFGIENLDGLDDVSAALDFTQARTSQDGSQFVAARISSPADYPWAAITVLFRPFPWEAITSMAVLTSLEGVLLAALVVRALGGLIVDRSRLMRSGPLLFGCAYLLVFIFLFSAIGNFGILSRQRTQVLPFVLILVALGLGADRARRGASRPPRNATAAT